MLITSPLTAPTVAAPFQDCDYVPLKYDKNYTGGGERWRAEASLRVYDLCDAGDHQRPGLRQGTWRHDPERPVTHHASTGLQAPA
jgi:hypothetical protein